ncbi:PolC-type DNA polymerase III, partial [Bacillus licheniformis]|uniref:3'-5' exonuclease n=1 Tax=Bacillus licheniformis TaxID=1402 RepID=UPI0011AA0BCD
MYVVFDFETTGLNYKTEQVIEVAAAKLDENLTPVATYNTLVALCEGMNISQFITDLTGITPELLEGKPSQDKVLGELKEFIGDSIVVAQYA